MAFRERAGLPFFRMEPVPGRDHPLRGAHLLRDPLSYHDTADLLAERGVDVDCSKIYRRVQKFDPERAKRTEKHRHWISVDRHVDETYVRVGGKWRYPWRAIHRHGQLIDFRLSARRDAKATKAFLRQTIARVRLHRSIMICTDKAPTYRKIIRDENRRYDPRFDSILHND